MPSTRTGYLLPDDLEPTEPVEPWAALLPSLGPTVMGWASATGTSARTGLCCSTPAANAGPTAWWDGRIVGGWRQSDTGEVVLQMLEDVGSEGRQALEQEVARLTEWFGGTRVLPRFPSPLSKLLAGPSPIREPGRPPAGGRPPQAGSSRNTPPLSERAYSSPAASSANDDRFGTVTSSDRRLSARPPTWRRAWMSPPQKSA